MSDIKEIISLLIELKCDNHIIAELQKVSVYLNCMVITSCFHVYGKNSARDAQIASHTSRLANDIAKMKESYTSYKCIPYDTIVTDALWNIQYVTEDVRKIRNYYVDGVCIDVCDMDVSEKFWKNIMYIIADEDSQRFVTKIIASTLLDYYTAVYCIAYEISS